MSSRSGVLPWVLLALWTAWISAAQGLALEVTALAPWVPDASLVLLLGLAAQLERRDLPLLALVVAAGRVSVSVAPPTAILAACLLLVLLVRALRTVIELRDVASRCLLAGLGTLAVERWHALVVARRALAAPGLGSDSLAAMWDLQLGAWPPGAWTRALATLVFALIFGPGLMHLPGLTPLRRRSTWHVAASARSW